MTCRLGKLIKLLSSDKAGEVTAAAAAIQRELQSAGLDIHALAEHVETLSSVPQSNRTEKPFDAWYSVRGFCAQHVELLNERDREFLASLSHWRGPLTEKQAQWLLDIEARIRRKTQ